MLLMERHNVGDRVVMTWDMQWQFVRQGSLEEASVKPCTQGALERLLANPPQKITVTTS